MLFSGKIAVCCASVDIYLTFCMHHNCVGTGSLACRNLPVASFKGSHKLVSCARLWYDFILFPAADVNLLKIPQDAVDEKYLFLSDILPTAWHATELGEVGENDTVAIWGAGPGEDFHGLHCSEVSNICAHIPQPVLVRVGSRLYLKCPPYYWA